MQPGGQPDMQQLMQQAQKMQEQLMSAQTELAQTQVSGQAGGGLVTATVSGAGEVLALVIDDRRGRACLEVIVVSQSASQHVWKPSTPR